MYLFSYLILSSKCTALSDMWMAMLFQWLLTVSSFHLMWLHFNSTFCRDTMWFYIQSYNILYILILILISFILHVNFDMACFIIVCVWFMHVCVFMCVCMFGPSMSGVFCHFPSYFLRQCFSDFGAHDCAACLWGPPACHARQRSRCIPLYPDPCVGRIWPQALRLV